MVNIVLYIWTPYTFEPHIHLDPIYIWTPPRLINIVYIMEEPLLKAIVNYYELKKNYEIKIVDYKKKLIRNEELTKREKRNLFKQFKPKCINCKKPGGTLFTSSNRVLKAVCNSDQHCSLDIEINLGNYANIINLDENYTKNIDDSKVKIIMTKLDFLFGYITDENVALDEFNKLKKKIGQQSEAQLLIQKRYNDVVHNLKKEEIIDEAVVRLYEEIYELKDIYKLYENDPKASYIVDMVEKYIKEIQPLADKIRNMKYVKSSVEMKFFDNKDPIAVLIEKEYTYNQLEQEVHGEYNSGVVKYITNN